MEDDPQEGAWWLPWYWTGRQWCAAFIVWIVLVIGSLIVLPVLTGFTLGID